MSWISLNNQPCLTRSIVIDLNPDKYNERLHFYAFMVNLIRYNGSCNTFDDLVEYVFRVKWKT